MEMVRERRVDHATSARLAICGRLDIGPGPVGSSDGSRFSETRGGGCDSCNIDDDDADEPAAPLMAPEVEAEEDEEPTAAADVPWAS